MSRYTAQINGKEVVARVVARCVKLHYEPEILFTIDGEPYRLTAGVGYENKVEWPREYKLYDGEKCRRFGCKLLEALGFTKLED